MLGEESFATVMTRLVHPILAATDAQQQPLQARPLL